MTTVLLVRHGLTATTGHALTGWTPGIPLDDRGQAQAAALAGRLAPLPLAAIVSSPLERCVQTASAIGDDRLQQETRGYVVPDAFTHGTSEQRKRWFLRGLKEGDIAACNTFAANAL